MKYPMINKQPRREVNVPELSGGINLRDSLTGVRDNQMTDCVNMWYKEGMLRTRPALATLGQSDFSFGVETSLDDFGGIKVHKEIKDIDGRVLISYWEKSSSLHLLGNSRFFAVTFMWQGIKDAKYGEAFVVEIPKTDNADNSEQTNKSDLYSSTDIGDGYFTVHKDGILYVVVHFGGQYFYKKWEYEKEDSDFEDMDDLNDFFAPLVIKDDVQLRGYNLFGGRYKGLYKFNTGEEKTKYNLPTPIPKNSKVRVHITYGGIEGVYEFKSDADTEEITKEYWDGKLKIKVVRADKSYIEILNGDGNSISKISDITFINLVNSELCYNAVCDVSEDMYKVFGMQQRTYYDAGAEGISGGARLFLTANRAGKERNLVMWSSLNNPLYWPENNYAYIGDKTQAVTGFGKQGENLIIFKDESTYYSNVIYNNNITEEDVIEQRIIDLEASSAYLAIRLFNNSIGCDLPNTIALCRNRLVWACTDGCVYTLVSNNQYSQRTIFKVSEMIEPRLKKERDIKYSVYSKAIEHAYAFDCGDHYCLAIDNRMYVMDYNSYGYRYISSFSKNDDSSVQIPWYYWELPGFRKEMDQNDLYNTEIDDGVRTVLSINNCIVFLFKYIGKDDVMTGRTIVCADIFDPEGEGDMDEVSLINKEYELFTTNSVIKNSVTTKFFDFGSARCAKNIDGVSIGFGNNGGTEINVGFLSNVGSESETVFLTNSDVDQSDAAYIIVKNFYPNACSVRTFGVKLECEGFLEIDSLSVKYRLLGGVKG